MACWGTAQMQIGFARLCFGFTLYSGNAALIAVLCVIFSGMRSNPAIFKYEGIPIFSKGLSDAGVCGPGQQACARTVETDATNGNAQTNKT